MSTEAGPAGLGSVRPSDAMTGGHTFGRSAAPRAGSISEQAVLEAIASLHPNLEGFSAGFSEPAGDPGIQVEGWGPVVTGHAGEALIGAPLDGTVPLDAFAIALSHSSAMAVTNALDLSPASASLDLQKSVLLLELDGDTIFGEVPSFTSMPLPAPLLLLLSAIGWLALGARGRAAG